MANNLTPVIHIEQGLIRGQIVDNLKDGEYWVFQGIPYAEPPLRELRFKDPVLPKCWTGIFKANVQHECCVCHDFFDSKEIIGTEDCLYLDIHTPKDVINIANQDHLKPVIVLITGVFTSKSIYNYETFLKNDVIFVNIHYRTGILGFLSFEDDNLQISGNAGLKDITMALNWINVNISKFGGDRNNVTVLGIGLGASYAHLISMTPKGKNLFNKLILISGSAILPWTSYKKRTDLIAEKLDCNCNEEYNMYKKLQSLTSRQLIETFSDVENLYSVPVIEKKYLQNAIITEDPTFLLTEGKYQHLPIMIGYGSNEALLLEKFQTEITPDTNNYELFVTPEFNVKRGTRLCKEIGKEIKQFYYGESLPSKSDLETYHRLITDIFVFRGIDSTVKIIKKKSRKSLFLFQFSTNGRWNLYKNLKNISHNGACYPDLIGYLFKYPEHPIVENDSMEERIHSQLVTMFCNFVKTKDPKAIEDDSLPIKWYPVTKKDYNYIEISDNLLLKTNPGKKTCDFWDDLNTYVKSRSFK
ncbi:esterase FE4-like [Chrysoperla carnea]|uniref:esterase FE4-like n=1 Tax=Chrysoperla carnea TaxID=189513 RepID=UPI001D06C417|nr:esterase FE4-like [Chrysoperla carnea]